MSDPAGLSEGQDQAIRSRQRVARSAMSRTIVAAHRASGAAERAAILVHHARHRVVASDVAQNFLHDVDLRARCWRRVTGHGDVLAILEAKFAHGLQCAGRVEVQDDDLLFDDIREADRGGDGNHGDVNPCIVVESGLCRGRAKQIENIGTVAGAGLQLFVVCRFDQGATIHWRRSKQRAAGGQESHAGQKAKGSQPLTLAWPQRRHDCCKSGHKSDPLSCQKPGEEGKNGSHARYISLPSA